MAHENHILANWHELKINHQMVDHVFNELSKCFFHFSLPCLVWYYKTNEMLSHSNSTPLWFHRQKKCVIKIRRFDEDLSVTFQNTSYISQFTMSLVDHDRSRFRMFENLDTYLLLCLIHANFFTFHKFQKFVQKLVLLIQW